MVFFSFYRNILRSYEDCVNQRIVMPMNHLTLLVTETNNLHNYRDGDLKKKQIFFLIVKSTRKLTSAKKNQSSDH